MRDRGGEREYGIERGGGRIRNRGGGRIIDSGWGE